ncbi:MAG: hypothetical protein AB7Q29_02775 [Vicinamibacterales bacterium]
MRVILWTEQAQADLAAIHAFIGQDSLHYASVTVRQLIAAVDLRVHRAPSPAEALPA